VNLELLTDKPTSPKYDTPLLFVHGARRAAWCWAEHFLPYFASHGYVAHAISLRGHGASEGHDRLQLASIADYVADVEHIVSQLECTPVLVGHSMGGFVLQHYLMHWQAPAAVLIAPAPHQGLSWPLVLDGARKVPGRLLHMLVTSGAYLGLSTADMTRELLLWEDMPQEQLEASDPRVQDESVRALLDILGANRPTPDMVDTPMLVVAAGSDRLIPGSITKELARAYNADLLVIPGVEHAMMLDPRWRTVADGILGWLEERALP
jgi:pimeloyl-ACP methyl ester carboxylesterase